MIDKEQIISNLAQVVHPAKGDKNIIDLGMLEEVEVQENKVIVKLAFPKNRDPLSEYIIGSVRANIYRNTPKGTEVEVRTVVRDMAPKAAPKKKSPVPELSLQELATVRHIIGVSSGKGGVGKSTVAINLAVALARLGYKVGLADADVYGPSLPTMTATQEQMPVATKEDDKDIIIPLEKYGVKLMSIGYFSQAGQALIWKGPMACSALKQMILQVRWGNLDFLLIDMPPGTGDIHITLVQDIPMEGTIIVTTPQNVALADVEKGVDMFRNEKINKKIYGLVENMAWFTPEELPNNKYYLFGKDGGVKIARSLGIDLLGQIPIVQSIREDADAGTPAACSDRPDGLAFMELAKKLIEKI